MYSSDMNQHEWVRACQTRYREQDLTPEPGGEWQEAHYPAPKGVGTDVIWLLHEDHQVQGVLQSEEYGRMCFFPNDVLKFLKKGPFIPNWFEIYDLYKKWARENNKKFPIETRRKSGKANIAKMPKEILSANGKANLAKIPRETRVANAKTMNEHPNTRAAAIKACRKNAKIKSKSVLCVETGVVYPSTCEAARQTDTDQASISQSCRKGCRAGGNHWKFVEEK